ncbi:serine/threonine-protein kinase [Calidifontibacter terrae]
MTPHQIAGYELGRLLGAGGMGEVYLARHPRLPREVVIKVMAPSGRDQTQARARFLREADLAARLDHPNIVTVYDRGEFEGLLWISMQYVDGPDAARTAAQGPLDPARVLGWATQVAEALDHAHSRGVVHRDVKPANILIAATPTGERALVTDFGIARSVELPSDLTETQAMVGSVAYASAEQLRGEPTGPAADVYSLAATLFHLLSGERPFPGSSVTAVLTAALTSPRPSLSRTRHGVPPEVDAVLARALSLDPAERHPSAGAFVDDLGAAWAGAATVTPTPNVHSHPTLAAGAPAARAGRRSRAPWLAAGVAVVLAAGGLTAYALGGHHAPGVVQASGLETSLRSKASAAAAARTRAPHNGVCDDGEFCLQFNSKQYGYGATADFDDSLANYGSKPPDCETFLGSGAGSGRCLKNSAASYWNRSSHTVRMYFNSGFTGRYLDVPPGARGDLPSWLKNNVASHQFR